MDPAIAGRDFDTTLDMIANGEALFFIMGDWSVGTFNAGGFTHGEDYVCEQAPTDWGEPGLHPQLRLGGVLPAERPRLHRGPEAARQHDPVA